MGSCAIGDYGMRDYYVVRCVAERCGVVIMMEKLCWTIYVGMSMCVWNDWSRMILDKVWWGLL